MRVISERILRDFSEEYPDAKVALKEWFRAARDADWRSLMDVRQIYPHADGVETEASGTLTVFNVCGNKYRLVTRIRYEWHLINIRCVLTHAEYDKGKWKE